MAGVPSLGRDQQYDIDAGHGAEFTEAEAEFLEEILGKGSLAIAPNIEIGKKVIVGFKCDEYFHAALPSH